MPGWIDVGTGEENRYVEDDNIPSASKGMASLMPRTELFSRRMAGKVHIPWTLVCTRFYLTFIPRVICRSEGRSAIW
jgi:hypothetical protein